MEGIAAAAVTGDMPSIRNVQNVPDKREAAHYVQRVCFYS
jgi:hypothetical protein